MTRIANLSSAVIDERKLKDYLLAAGHPLGKAKARFLVKLGFSTENLQALRAALLRLAENSPIAARAETVFGSKYVVDGPLEAPGGRTAEVRAIWFVESGESKPRFVTAYPLKGARE